jgi:hypothetical protein
MVMFYKYGGKQLYYFNTNDGAGEIDVSKMVREETFEAELQIADDAACESCTI